MPQGPCYELPHTNHKCNAACRRLVVWDVVGLQIHAEGYHASSNAATSDAEMPVLCAAC